MDVDILLCYIYVYMIIYVYLQTMYNVSLYFDLSPITIPFFRAFLEHPNDGLFQGGIQLCEVPANGHRTGHVNVS